MSKLHLQTPKTPLPLPLSHTFAVKRGATLCLARCLSKKRSLAVPFPLTHRQAWPKHTGTLSSLLAIHIILSLCPRCEDTNFTTSPSSQSICSKIVVERVERDTWCRLRLKASLNGGYRHRFPLSEIKDNRLTTLHFSPFAAHQMYSEALYLLKETLFFSIQFQEPIFPYYCR